MQSIDHTSVDQTMSAGCVRGEIFERGTVSMQLPDTEADLFVKLIRHVEEDDFHGILEFARRACMTFDMLLKRTCAFIVDLQENDQESSCTDTAHAMDVKNANVLQYAMSLSKMKAAASLVVVAPELLRQQCHVSMIQYVSTSTKHNGVTIVTIHTKQLCAMTWSVLDISSFFCELYDTEMKREMCAERHNNVKEVWQEYKIAFDVIKACQSASGYSILFGDGPRDTRIAQAENRFCDADTFMHRLLLACLRF
jgi:hypothetical protein